MTQRVSSPRPNQGHSRTDRSKETDNNKKTERGGQQQNNDLSDQVFDKLLTRIVEQAGERAEMLKKERERYEKKKQERKEDEEE